MKKAVVFLYFCDYMAIDAAIDLYKEGFELYLIGCDRHIGFCHANPTGFTPYCMLCRYNMRKQTKEYLDAKGIPYHYLAIGEIISSEIKENSSNVKFNYQSVSELKNVTYKNVEIGYGAFSVFVSFTRNITPSFNQTFHEYVDNILRKEVQMIDALDSYFDEILPDIVVFHNGRFNNVKPFLGLCQQRGIDYIATETYEKEDWTLMKDFTMNDIPHSMSVVKSKIDKAWISAGVNGLNIGRTFFEKRRAGKNTGDKKIYVKNQHKGELPSGFDNSKYNIAIFNSSEDEFFSISKEYDKGVLYPRQYEALKDIFEHFKDRPDIHFYLRIHPNLANVPYKSHTDLYRLKYPNVSIISPSSSVSSYALLDASDKVVVFNSTMGIEASYWGKPVVALNKGLFSGFNIVYEPSDKQDMFSLLDNKNLQAVNNPIDCCKIACYLLGCHTIHYTNIHPVRSRWFLAGKELKWTSTYKIFASEKLYCLIEKFVYHMQIISNQSRKWNNLGNLTK